MSIVSAQGLGKYYGAQDVFAGLEFAIAHGDKVALVGPNGAGKTTLLRLILGLEEPTAGSVHRARGLRTGYLPQTPEFPSQQTLYGEMLSVFAALQEQQRALEMLAEQMASAPNADELIARYAEAEHKFDLAGGYTYEHRIRRVLSGLGFGPDAWAWPISVLSGGQVTRALLAKLLLQEPDLLVLDEPTNYLDLEALEWLESYLQEWPNSLLVVSHDRYFLNKVVSRVWELNHGRLEFYRGNYSSYVLQRQERMARRLEEYRKQQEAIAQTEDFIRRYKAGQRSKEARGRETRLERLERLEAPQANRQMRLRMSATLRAGDNVLSSNGVVIGYEAKPNAAEGGAEAYQHVLFRSGPFLLQRGQRVALLGPNGSGKTTFLRTILGQVKPLAGHIRIGASVRIGYLPQSQEHLSGDKTVLDHILAAGKLEIEQARNLLGRFLFSGDDVFKPTRILSGGERSRLALALLSLQDPNFLLLDEPTTHLDLESQEVLQEVLANFGGTMLFISHDRYLVDALATHVWVIHDGNMRQFKGNYSEYMQAIAQEEAERQQKLAEAPSAKAYEERRRRERQIQRAEREQAQRIEALEAEINRLEQQLSNLTGLIELASARQDLARLRLLSSEYQQLEATLARNMEEWERQTSARPLQID